MGVLLLSDEHLDRNAGSDVLSCSTDFALLLPALQCTALCGCRLPIGCDLMTYCDILLFLQQAAGAADDFLEFQQQLDQLHTSDTLLTSAEVASAGHALKSSRHVRACH